MLGAALDWGTLPGWLTLAALIGAAFWLPRRGQTGPAIESLEANLRVLERRCHELEQQGKTDAATIAELRGRTDVTIALAPIVEWSGRHEERAQQRHDLTVAAFEKSDARAEVRQAGLLKVLDLIAYRLGADPNHHQTEVPA